MSSTPNFNFEIIHKLYIIAKHAIQLIHTPSQIFVFILIFSSNAARQPATSTATRLLPLYISVSCLNFFFLFSFIRNFKLYRSRSPNIQRYYPHLET